jgi:hypothetical protein
MRTIGNGTIRRVSEGVSYGSTNVQQLCDWRLVSNDDHATISAANYFNSLAADLKKGESILATVDYDGTLQLRVYVVTANTGTAVTVALQTVA